VKKKAMADSITLEQIRAYAAQWESEAKAWLKLHPDGFKNKTKWRAPSPSSCP
jgi:hypothetical protein